MTKPAPEQFGLTAETVASLTQEQAQRNKRRKSSCEKITWGLWAVGAVLSAPYVLSIAKANHASAPLVATGFILIVGGLMVSGVVYAVLFHLTYIFFPDPPIYRQLDSYRASTALYEAWLIRTQEEFWNSLSGRRFEIEVKNLFYKAGCRPRITRTTGDEGVDIFLGDGTIVQCKAHKVPVSPAVVRELYGTLRHFGAPKAILISTGGFTKGVHEFVQGKPIELWDTNSLIALQKRLEE